MKQTIDSIRKSLSKIYPETEVSGFIRIIIEYLTSKNYRLAQLDEPIFDEKQQGKANEILKRLSLYEPIQHILGETIFYDLAFYVDKNVLIPRPETEELVELIINENKYKESSILDIGTGSGCIAITLAHKLRDASVSAWDVSEKALAIAKANNKKNGTRVRFEQVDVLGKYPDGDQFDIIVSNPPYIMEYEKADMDANVLEYEPYLALFVPDSKPLLFYERIADVARELLRPLGKLYFEINQAKGKETIEMLQAKGFSDIVLHQDINGCDRITRAVWKG